MAIGIRAVATRPARWKPAVTWRPIGAKGVAQFGHAAAQLVIRAMKLFAALEFIRRKTEAREHSEKEEAVPDLQSPADGFEYHGPPSMQ